MDPEPNSGRDPLRALVTGGSGFIGNVLVRYLKNRGGYVATVGRNPVTTSDRHFDAPHFEDVASYRRILDRLRPTAIYHLAGAAVGPEEEVYASNVVFAEALLEAASLLEQKPFLVLAGSAAEYGLVSPDQLPINEDLPCRPTTPYARAKLRQTERALDYAARGLAVVVARLFNVVGPRMPTHLSLGRFMSVIGDMGPQGGTLTTGQLDSWRDFIAVEDVVAVLEALSQLRAPTDVVFNVCTGKATQLRKVVDLMIAACGKPVQLEVEPRLSGVSSIEKIIGNPARLQRLGLTLSTPDFAAIFKCAFAK
jgi:nucleoside-diphosphate-sugar epimerase